MPTAGIRPSHVRHWRKQLLDAGVSAVTAVAKAYLLLKAVLNTALYDGVTRRNLAKERAQARRTGRREAIGHATRAPNRKRLS